MEARHLKSIYRLWVQHNTDRIYRNIGWEVDIGTEYFSVHKLTLALVKTYVWKLLREFLKTASQLVLRYKIAGKNPLSLKSKSSILWRSIKYFLL